MLGKIPWATKIFSGPKDPHENPYSAFCHICSANVSIKSKGYRDIIRHWLRERHFRKEQKYRDYHGMDILDERRQVLTGVRLENERKEFEHHPLVDLCERYPYYGEVVEVTGEFSDVTDEQLRIQLKVSIDFLTSIFQHFSELSF